MTQDERAELDAQREWQEREDFYNDQAADRLQKLRAELVRRRDSYLGAWREDGSVNDRHRSDEYQHLIDLADGNDTASEDYENF